MRADQKVARPQAHKRGLEIARQAVAKRVVAHHPLNAGDAAGGKEVRGANQKSRTCRTGLIGVDLGRGHPRVVVDGRMHIIEAHQPMPAGLGGAPMHAPAAPVGDAPELLDIEMDQLARGLALVANPCHRPTTDRDSGQRIQIAQVRHPMTGKNAPDGRRTHPEFGGDPLRPAARAASELTHAPLELSRDAMRDPMRSARAIDKPSWALGAVAAKPLVGARARTAQLCGGITHAIPGQDALD